MIGNNNNIEDCIFEYVSGVRNDLPNMVPHTTIDKETMIVYTTAGGIKDSIELFNNNEGSVTMNSTI